MAAAKNFGHYVSFFVNALNFGLCLLFVSLSQQLHLDMHSRRLETNYFRTHLKVFQNDWVFNVAIFDAFQASVSMDFKTCNFSSNKHCPAN